MFDSKLVKDEGNVSWTLTDIIDYVDTKMELDQSCKIILDEEILTSVGVCSCSKKISMLFLK